MRTMWMCTTCGTPRVIVGNPGVPIVVGWGVAYRKVFTNGFSEMLWM